MLLLDKIPTSIPQAVITYGDREEVLRKDYYLLEDGNYFLRTGLVMGLLVTPEGEEIQLCTAASVGIRF